MERIMPWHSSSVVVSVGSKCQKLKIRITLGPGNYCKDLSYEDKDAIA